MNTVRDSHVNTHRRAVHGERLKNEDYKGDFDFAPAKGDRVQIGADVLKPELIDGMKQLGAALSVDAGPSEADWNRMASDLSTTQSLSKDDLKQVQEFVKGLRSMHKKLHAEFRGSGYDRNSPALPKLQKVHVFLHAFDDARDTYRERVKGEELKRLTDRPESAAVAAYYMWSNSTQSGMTKVLDVLHGIQDGNGAVTFEGNTAVPLTRDYMLTDERRLLGHEELEARPRMAGE